MTFTLGEGEHKYRVVEDWAKLPTGWDFRDVAGVGIDSKDQVYVFNRGRQPMMVFDREGNFLRSWGSDIFNRAHGLHIGPDDALYCTDDGDHTVRKITPEGKVLLEIGVPGEPAPYVSGEPFHRCTHTALSPDNHIFVSDGYGNARVHKYTPEGKLVMSWGEPGTAPGQFNIVPNIVADDDGATVVPVSLAPELVEKAQTHAEWEEFSRIKLSQGGHLRKYYPLSEEGRAEYEAWKKEQGH